MSLWVRRTPEKDMYFTRVEQMNVWLVERPEVDAQRRYQFPEGDYFDSSADLIYERDENLPLDQLVTIEMAVVEDEHGTEYYRAAIYPADEAKEAIYVWPHEYDIIRVWENNETGDLETAWTFFGRATRVPEATMAGPEGV